MRKSRDHKLVYDEQITYFFWLSLNKKMLSAYMENTLNSEKSLKIDLSIFTNFGPKPKNLEKNLFYTLDRFEMIKKTISHYYHLKVINSTGSMK